VEQRIKALSSPCADGFTLAKGAEHPEASLALLNSIGSKESQEAFNLLKGSIPARIDVGRSKFDAYHQWSNDKLVLGCVAGEAAPAAFRQALNDAVTTFILDKNVDNFAKALVQAAKSRAQRNKLRDRQLMQTGSALAPLKIFRVFRHFARMCCNFVVEPKVGADNPKFSSSQRTDRE
jgi:hypothetical protein